MMPEEMITLQMKAITIHQPWASLIASGAKRYETRGWKTNHRGRIAIHASKVWSNDHQAFVDDLNDKFPNLTIPEALPLGALICVCDLVDCVPVEQIRDQLSPQELELGDYSDGRYAWELKVVKVAPEPIPMGGKQGVWTWHYEMPNTFQSLAKACEYYDIHNPHPHRALGDALTARLVWLAMTKKAVPA